MKQQTDKLTGASASTLAALLRNPLVVYGLILLGGGGPLGVAYAGTDDPNRALILMWALIVFVFGMGGFFCYLVAFKPRHLYAPSEIPLEAIGRSIYKDMEGLTDNLVEESDESKRRAIAESLRDQLLAVRDRSVTIDVFIRQLINEINRKKEEFEQGSPVYKELFDIQDRLETLSRLVKEDLARPRREDHPDLGYEVFWRDPQVMERTPPADAIAVDGEIKVETKSGGIEDNTIAFWLEDGRFGTIQVHDILRGSKPKKWKITIFGGPWWVKNLTMEQFQVVEGLKS